MAARRLAADIEVPSPTPMMTSRTEAVVLIRKVSMVEWDLLTGVGPGMYHLFIFPGLPTCTSKAQILGQFFPAPDLLQVVVKITNMI